MPRITLLPSGVSAEVPAGTPLLAAVSAAGAAIETQCGGAGSCGGCLVRVEAGALEHDSAGLLPAEALERGMVLACKARLDASDVTVELPGRSGEDKAKGQFAESAAPAELPPELLPAAGTVRPVVVRRTLSVAPPQLEDGLSDLDRLETAARKAWPELHLHAPLPFLAGLADGVRGAGGRATLTAAMEEDGLHCLDIKPGEADGPLLGIACDLGTTSVAAQLVDLVAGTVLETRSDYNGQIARGLDVIGRINYAARPGGLEELRALALGTINGLVRRMLRARGAESRDVVAATLAGNTTMTHLLLGLPPEHIRLEPYTPTVRELPVLEARELGLEIHPLARVFLSPAVGSYVGGDISAGLLCTRLAAPETAEDGGQEIRLFLDIGTNGELVVGNADFMLACACSAGPAFEGGGIECGMPASYGAVDRVRIDPATGLAEVSTIGGLPPAGVCGSGMISLLAGLFRSGWLDPAGRLDRSRPCPAIELEGRRARYVMARADGNGGRDVYVTETDVDNVIRAKAAIYSAAHLLLAQVGLDFGSIRTFSIAGGFGRFLNIEDAITIGLLPDIDRCRFRYLGNSSLAGSRMALVSAGHRRRQVELARRMTYVELMTSPEYMDEYTAALFLPHTDAARFPTAAEKHFTSLDISS